MPEKQHRRPPTINEQDILRLVHVASDRVALMPVFFNGEQRFALVLIEENEAGKYVRLLAVLTLPEDQVLNSQGVAGSFTPPVPQASLN